MPLMRFIDLNWDINNIHKYPRRVNDLLLPLLCKTEEALLLEKKKTILHTCCEIERFTHYRVTLTVTCLCIHRSTI